MNDLKSTGKLKSQNLFFIHDYNELPEINVSILNLPSNVKKQSLKDLVDILNYPLKEGAGVPRIEVSHLPEVYKDIENTFPGDAEAHIDPILEELGVDKIEDILYCELDKVETFYNTKIDQLPEGYGANFKSYKNEMYETLREGDAQDMYAYMDNVTAIIDDEMVGAIGRLLEGVQVNEETLALDLIEQVGPIPGEYLSKKHTRDWWQKEQKLNPMTLRPLRIQKRSLKKA